MAKDDTDLEDELDEAREDDGQIYVDRDKVDFDPDEGLLSGTALDGTSEIPGSENDGSESDGASDTDDSEGDDDSGGDTDTQES
jgi:hypothetical protein